MPRSGFINEIPVFETSFSLLWGEILANILQTSNEHHSMISHPAVFELALYKAKVMWKICTYVMRSSCALN